MTITLNIDELNYYTEPKKVEAYRRAVEIREFCQAENGNSAAGRMEHFVWKTPVRNGVEIEEVSIDTGAGKIVYRVTLR